MPRKTKKPRPQTTRHGANPASASRAANAPHPRAWHNLNFDPRHADPQFPNVPVRWLLRAFALTLLSVVACAWLLLCFLFWQGSWQLLYHPSRTIKTTPAAIHLPFQSISFDASETGVTQLAGWWIPANTSLPQTAILVLHGADGDLSDTLPVDAWLHAQHQNVFAIDYLGYGKSANGKPSEQQMLRDAASAIAWLAMTQRIRASGIVLWGTGIGATIAAELTVSSPRVGGIVLDHPTEYPLDVILNDPRSQLVPARLLLRDHYDLSAAASRLPVPSLWLLPVAGARPDALLHDPSPETTVWLRDPFLTDPHAGAEFQRWLDTLPQFSTATSR